MIFNPQIKETERVYEKILTNVFADSQEASLETAKYIVDQILLKQASNKPFVLGMATGNSPKKLYEYILNIYKERKLSFRNVYTVNLDEYYGLKKSNPNSFRAFMDEHFFDHVDIPKNQILVPKGNVHENEISKYCLEFEDKIQEWGGIDLQILGIGQNGHIGFNEPGSNESSITRLVPLDKTTRLAASKTFFGLENTPKKAITMGVNTILNAREIVLLAWGETKAEVIKKAVEEDITSQIPASYLQHHRKCVFVIDYAGASLLTRKETPWKLSEVKWEGEHVNKAVIHLANVLDKGILMLSEEDYISEGLGSLIAKYEDVEELNHEVFDAISATIVKKKILPNKQKVLLFSPHPDDDIISMGATFRKLHEEGHEVHVAYQTSGNIAVSKDYAFEMLDFTNHLLIKNNIKNEVISNLREQLDNHSEGIDPHEIRELKTQVRESEARATCRFVGIPSNQIHFLRLPFYETGKVQKGPLTSADLKIITDLISSIQPDLIFAAGDLADPHGTHKTCLDAVLGGLDLIKHESFLNKIEIWLYRGAWAEWNVEETDVAVPMSAADVLKKRHGIFKHQSQKDVVMFQGNDNREFWQRAEDRNQQTALAYRKLGFPAFVAMESFRKFDFRNEKL